MHSWQRTLPPPLGTSPQMLTMPEHEDGAR